MQKIAGKPNPKEDLKSLSLPELQKKMGSSPEGLSQTEAQRRLAQYGSNGRKKINPFFK
jgi:H+-transporting ATPase